MNFNDSRTCSLLEKLLSSEIRIHFLLIANFFFFEQQKSLRSEKDLARVASLKARSSHCVNNVLFWAEHPCFSSELPWRSTDAEASIFFPPNAMHPLWTALRWLCSFECDFEITSRLSLSSTIEGKKKSEKLLFSRT